MRNGFFKIVKTPGGFGLSIFAPKDGGEPVRIQELVNYLDMNGINYDLGKVKEIAASTEDAVLELGTGECPAIRENYNFTVSDDNLRGIARFTPASDTGERMTADEFIKDMAFRMIKFGIQEELLRKLFASSGIYCTDIVVAKGKPARQGKDATIEYFFNTDVHAKPAMNEDGSVDYFHLGIVNNIKAGDKLAQITPEDPGESGMTIQGAPIKPRDVKKMRHNFGKNIKLSDDRLTITSEIDGMVALTDGAVFVSGVYAVENVDNSTGNIDFTGSVQVNGNVATNFEVKASGDVIIYGVVEGAHIVAGGNIIIARGVNGMSKGFLEAGNNIISKFIENSKVKAGGYVNTESILHSDVVAGTEIVVTGKHGFITGGHVQADSKVEARTLGAVMGSQTVIEVGANPELKNEYNKTQKEIGEIVKAIKDAQPIIQNFMEKKAKGARMTADQLAYVKQTAETLETKKKELTEKNARMQELSQIFDPNRKSEVIVNGEVYPGTIIIIGDVSMTVKDSYKYCRFVRSQGEVKMSPL
ncbi:MAG: FapA family protein [Lachnospiraceae bacterium]|nr:FapA family protein [Lachnospiraceae bacterium]